MRYDTLRRVQVRPLNDFRPAAGRAGRGCFGRRSGSDTSFVGASAPKKMLGDFLILPLLRFAPVLRERFLAIPNNSNTHTSFGAGFFKRDSIPSDPFWLAALAVPSGRDSPASGALLLEDGKKRQR